MALLWIFDQFMTESTYRKGIGYGLCMVGPILIWMSSGAWVGEIVAAKSKTREVTTWK